jgi:hypothetical protein
MRASQPGMTVGIALEPTNFVASGSIQTVIVLISPSYWAPSAGAATGATDVLSEVGQSWLTWDFSRLFSSIVDAFASVLGIEFQQGKVKADELCAGEVCVNSHQLEWLIEQAGGAVPDNAPADEPDEPQSISEPTDEPTSESSPQSDNQPQSDTPEEPSEPQSPEPADGEPTSETPPETEPGPEPGPEAQPEPEPQSPEPVEGESEPSTSDEQVVNTETSPE